MAHAGSAALVADVTDLPGWKPTGISITGTHARPAVGAGGADLGKVGPHDGILEKDASVHHDEKAHEA